jgi:hypothetical protein
MKKLICVTIIVLFIVTCKKSSQDMQSSNTANMDPATDSVSVNASIIGKWKLSATEQNANGKVYWQPADTIKAYAIFTSDSLIFQGDTENDTSLYKITEPGVFYIYRGTDSFRILYSATPALLSFNNAYCSETCGQKYIRVQ